MTGLFDHAFLGGLFRDVKAGEIWSADRQLRHMLAFEAAFTRALGSAGKVSPGVAETVAVQIENCRVDIAELRRGAARDGVPVPDLVRQLKAAAGDDAAAVHTGATSQDVIDTALALTLREFNAHLSDGLNNLTQRLGNLNVEFGSKTMMGRTRMQAALPIKVRDRVEAWLQPMHTYLMRLDQIRPRIEILQLGGAVGDCAALEPYSEAIANDIAIRLGLCVPMRSWHSMRNGIAEYGGLLSLISGTIGKMGLDICLMSQQGIDDIVLHSGGGSSAMPHKQNPVLAELLVTLARYNATQLAGLHTAMLHEQERSGAAWMLEWMILPDMARVTANSVATAVELCSQVTNIGNVSD